MVEPRTLPKNRRRKKILLDVFRINDEERLLRDSNNYQEFALKMFLELEEQRESKKREIQSALNDAAIPFSFDSWVRFVSPKYSAEPLSAKGSMLASLGGRFNIGNIVNNRHLFVPFPAIYLGQDFATCYCEAFQLQHSRNVDGLSADELSLLKAKSCTSFSVEGTLSRLIDLSSDNLDHMDSLISIFSGFSLSSDLRREAIRIGVSEPCIVVNLDGFRKALSFENWRGTPNRVGVPSNSQIIGSLCESAGVNGVLYSSSKYSGKKCLCIFPKNMDDDSNVQVSDIDDYPWMTFGVLNKDTAERHVQELYDEIIEPKISLN